MLQKPSTNFLISIFFFPPGEGNTPPCPTPTWYFRSRTMSTYFLQLCSYKCVMSNLYIIKPYKTWTFVCFRSHLSFALVYENSRPLFHKILDPPLTRSLLISFYCFAGNKNCLLSPWETNLSPCLVKKKNLSPCLVGKKDDLPCGENHSPHTCIYQLVPKYVMTSNSMKRTS